MAVYTAVCSSTHMSYTRVKPRMMLGRYMPKRLLLTLSKILFVDRGPFSNNYSLGPISKYKIIGLCKKICVTHIIIRCNFTKNGVKKVYTGNDHIILFDMDGTLSEPRKKVNISIIDPMIRLSRCADIGIVTGSPMEYLEQQCHPLWDVIGHCTTLFPCNGTKKYVFGSDEKFTLYKESNMIEEIGRKSYNAIIAECAKKQHQMMYNQDLPFTGTFLQYRGSLLNWCPIGRDSGDDERKAWIDIDNEKNIREVTMFPMNQNAQDLMMNAPSDVDEKQLKELNLKILDKKK